MRVNAEMANYGAITATLTHAPVDTASVNLFSWTSSTCMHLNVSGFVDLVFRHDNQCIAIRLRQGLEGHSSIVLHLGV